jgi:hypothetical protein
MSNLKRFYNSLIRLENATEKRRRFGEKPVSQNWWPTKGVYFFLDNNELSVVPNFPMVVYIGTHGISSPYKTFLYKRLSQHWGKSDGGGDHRSSILRGYVGASIINKNNANYKYPKWDLKENNCATAETKEQELSLEKEVSTYIKSMNILVLNIEDWKDRKYIKANSIAFLSSAIVEKENPISKDWLGKYCFYRKKKLDYQLWNKVHCGDVVDELFFDKFDKFVDLTIKNWKKII